MARKSERLKLYETKLSSKMTKKQLQDYIRKATKEVNKTIGKKGTGYENVDRSVNYLRKLGGTRKEKGVEKLGMKLNKKKDELYLQARRLKAHFGIDSETRLGREMYSQRERSAYQKFSKKLTKDRDIKIDISTYRGLVEIFGALGSKTVEMLTSTQISNLYAQKDELVDEDTFLDIVISTMSQPENQGIRKATLLKRIHKALTEEASRLKKELEDME